MNESSARPVPRRRARDGLAHRRTSPLEQHTAARPARAFTVSETNLAHEHGSIGMTITRIPGTSSSNDAMTMRSRMTVG
jgi:hypothetical protein